MPALVGLFFIILSGLYSQSLYAQDPEKIEEDSLQQIFRIDSIVIIGNRKTAAKTVLRELTLRPGDTLRVEEIDLTFAQNRYLLLNTGLFTDAEFTLAGQDTLRERAYVSIKVKEALFILPVPIFELADRNFTVWWDEMDRDLSRINYGLRLYHMNLTGRRDRLKLAGQWGYTRKFEADYQIPGLNRKQTFGVGINLLTTFNREIAYRTGENKLLFENSPDEFLFKRQRISGRAFFRPRLFFSHELTLSYQNTYVADMVANDLNPEFLGGGRQRISWIALNYEYIFDRRDIRPYPLTGNQFVLKLRKQGFGIFGDLDALNLTARYAHYLPVKRRFSLEAIAQGRYGVLRNRQPYYNIRALGYEEDYIRGYEFYVIDGIDYFYQKTSLRFEIFNDIISFEKISPIEALKKMPTRVYFNLNNDIGYAYDKYRSPDNPLNNTLLWGRGVGLDIIVYYALVVQLEYSFNHLGESGFFLHIRAGVN